MIKIEQLDHNMIISIFYYTIIKQLLLCSQGMSIGSGSSPNNSIDNVTKIIQS